MWRKPVSTYTYILLGEGLIVKIKFPADITNIYERPLAIGRYHISISDFCFPYNLPPIFFFKE